MDHPINGRDENAAHQRREGPNATADKERAPTELALKFARIGQHRCGETDVDHDPKNRLNHNPDRGQTGYEEGEERVECDNWVHGWVSEVGADLTHSDL